MTDTTTTPTTTARSSGFRWVVLALIFLIYMIASADRANIGFALPFLRKEFVMTNTEAGALLSLFLWGYAVAQIPSGLAISKFGVKRIFPWAMILTSAFTGFMGLSTSTLWLKVNRFFLGIAEGPLPIGITTTINNWFPAREKGTASGVFLSAVKFGPVIVPPVCALIVSFWGWREIFYIFAIPGIVLSIVWWFLVTNTPTESRFCSQAERDLIAEKPVPGAGAVKTEARKSFGLLDKLIRAKSVETLDTNAKVLRSWDVWGCAIGYAFQIGVSNYLLAWIPTYLITVKKFSIVNTGFVAAAPWVGAVLGNLIGGWISDRVFDKRRKPGMLFSAVATAIMLYVLLSGSVDPTIYSLLLFLTGMVFSIGFSAYMAYPMSFTSKQSFPFASSLVNTGGQIGGACAPLIAGILLDRYSWDVVFATMAAGSLLTVLVIATIREPIEE